MGKVISVVNQKGGVGKTTTSVNIAAALAFKDKKVLLVDLDPQGNATSGVGIDKRNTNVSVYDLISDNANIEDVTIKTEFKNLYILPSNISLAGAEIEMIEMENRMLKIKNILEPISNNYDYIFIDCPPSLGLITLNALTASNSFLVPIQCEFYALEGLSQLMMTVRTVKKLYNSQLELEGVLLTMYDGRLNLTIQVANEVKKFFPDKVYKTVIPRNVRLSEAPSFGQPVLYFDKYSKGSNAYLELANEIIID
ncbi:MAG: ParA family protein [Oscillospiraceae bacterium]|nr:ParA family protein [Oscillospiraceae bacterium]